MSGLIGKKVGMTSVYDAKGKLVACTVIEAGPCVVSQVKTVEKDGYDAIQLAYGDKREKNTPNALVGHFKKASSTPKAKVVEFSKFEVEKQLGDVIGVDLFEEGEYVDIIGLSKGKGFQGVVKRYGFSGVGDATHGQHDRLRAPGSVGASSFPSKVVKGLRMAGRMGGDNIKIMNVEILKVMPEKNVIVIKGSVPGSKGSYLKLERWK